MNLIKYLPLICILTALSCVSAPEWVDSYPKDPAFYTGIGLSNSGDREQDLDIAYSRALKNIASEISVSVESSNTLNKTVISDGDSTDFDMKVTEYLSTQVNLDLRFIEMVDSYYQKNVGQWIYLRLNREQWKEFEDREVERVLKSVITTLDNLNGSYSHQLEELNELEKMVSGHPFLFRIDNEVLLKLKNTQDELKELNRSFSLIVEDNSTEFKINNDHLTSYFSFLDKELYKEYSLYITLEYSDFPAYSKKMKVSNLTAIYKLKRNDELIHTWVDEKYKGVGLDMRQAHENAYIKYTKELTPQKIISWLQDL